MLMQVIWWLGILAEAILLYQGWRVRLTAKYPVFYSYILCVLLEDLGRYLTYTWYPKIYSTVYWDSQFLVVIVGCLMIFEIYRVGLTGFPGTARMARNLLLFVFAMVFAKALVTNPGTWWSALTAVKLERDLRLVQGAALLALTAVFIIYSIPAAKNLKGILFGYGIFLATSILQLTVMVRLGSGLADLWAYLRSGAYFLVLIVWIISLWNRQEAPKAARAITLDEDYKMLVATTRKRFARSRMALGKVVRP